MIDELGRWFEADVLALKSEALGVALAGTTSTAAAARAATAAMMLTDQADEAGRRELASTLADTAYTAARKSRDGGLVKAAYRRRQELAESGK